ncbi:hypothetical protein [Thalassomonas actiniarum]|uniref:Uncharacterized protein n=1 Tax=Thalassomonas actiniarum TaxID=485447 RepID=A0AAE9YV44_9GAMM|nr:hypothetical protein [Thalassomonas actiniarum]WDE01701.1 hypothetical protein SG35_000955 [Thalassomonas actiniarum]
MQTVIGGDVIEIHAPQDRLELKFVVRTANGEITNVRFTNSDNSPIKVDFQELSLKMLYDPESEITSFGEFEYVNKIENGFEIIGDFGMVWVYCELSMPKL